jgi:hypothetical protein
MKIPNPKRRYIIGAVTLVLVAILYLLNWSWLLLPVVLVAMVLAFWS